jgi:hypothetical protein
MAVTNVLVAPPGVAAFERYAGAVLALLTDHGGRLGGDHRGLRGRRGPYGVKRTVITSPSRIG